MGKTNYLEDAVLNFFLRNDPDTFTPPATVYVALLTAVADEEAGTVTEVDDAGDYERQPVTFTDPGGAGATENAAEVTFPKNTAANLGTVTHFAIYDALAAGNPLYIGALDQSFDYDTNVSPLFEPGDLDITED